MLNVSLQHYTTNYSVLWCLTILTLPRCHGSIPPPNPEFTVKPMKKKMEKHIECTPGTPCPPCQEVVLVPCFGEHLGQERAVSFEQHGHLLVNLPPSFPPSLAHLSMPHMCLLVHLIITYNFFFLCFCRYLAPKAGNFPVRIYVETFSTVVTIIAQRIATC